jgi:hypothetical protein
MEVPHNFPWSFLLPLLVPFSFTHRTFGLVHVLLAIHDTVVVNWRRLWGHAATGFRDPGEILYHQQARSRRTSGSTSSTMAAFIANFAGLIAELAVISS